MPLLNLSCVNCSAPLQITDDVDRFACSYCGSSQMVERKGGAVTLRRVESAIHAVQRGTDRTAAELAIPRLTNELNQLTARRTEAIASEKETLRRARSGRKSLTILTLVVVFFGGLMLIGSATVRPAIQVFLNILWYIAVIAIPVFVFKTVKMPRISSKSVVSDIDMQIARVEEHLKANRRILDELPG